MVEGIEEHHRLQLEGLVRQPLRLVPRDVQPRFGGRGERLRPAAAPCPDQVVAAGDHGQAIGGAGRAEGAAKATVDAMGEERAAFRARSGENPVFHACAHRRGRTAQARPAQRRPPNLFPNVWITLGGLQLCLRLPRGPSHTELWWFTILPKAMPQPVRQMMLRQAIHMFGPAGLLEQDDGENWSQSTRAAGGYSSRKLGAALMMGLGHDEVRVGENGQQSIEGYVGEHARRVLRSADGGSRRATGPSWRRPAPPRRGGLSDGRRDPASAGAELKPLGARAAAVRGGAVPQGQAALLDEAASSVPGWDCSRTTSTTGCRSAAR